MTTMSAPVPEPVLLEMFSFVSRQIGSVGVGPSGDLFAADVTPNKGCDHTLGFTREFIRNHSLDEDRIIAWLMALKAYCDCEVMWNIASYFYPDDYRSPFWRNLRRHEQSHIQ